MKTENLIKACDSFDFFFNELREAHKDAVDSGNQFAEIAIFALIEPAVKLQTQLARIKDATIETDSIAKKRKST
jgi:hypothetical protein